MKKFFIMFTLLLSMFMVQDVGATKDKVGICHIKGNGDYVHIVVDDDGAYSGHIHHEGDIFNVETCPSPTNTATSTNTATATDVPTNTATSTATSTATERATSTATNTVEPTATETATVIHTATNTATEVATLTPTVTLTEPPLPTNTAEASATNTPDVCVDFDEDGRICNWTPQPTYTATETSVPQPSNTVSPSTTPLTTATTVDGPPIVNELPNTGVGDTIIDKQNDEVSWVNYFVGLVTLIVLFGLGFALVAFYRSDQVLGED